MKRVLGIDCSSTTIGVCLLEINGDDIRFVDCSYLKPIKTGSIVDRMVDTRDKMKKIIEDYAPDYIGIEDIISFMQGKSTASTIITLTTFNRMICLLARDYLNKSPELFNVMSIRHGLKLNKKLPSKEEIPDLTAHHLGVKFPYKMNKKGLPAAESYDMADATAVALFYCFNLTNRIKQKKAKKK